jgi:hypothetical protein
MARHPSSPRAGQRARNRTYTLLLAGLLVVMVVAFYYGPFGKNEAGPIDQTLVPDANSVAEQPKVEPPIVTPSPADVQPEPAPPVPTPEPVQAVAPQPGPAAIPAIQENSDAVKLIAEATALINQKPSRIVQARDKLNEALRLPMSAEQRIGAKDQLSKLSEQWLFSRTVVPGDPLCESYLVKSGDLLALIAERYRVPYEILMQINNISRPEALQAGETIKVVDGPFHVKVYRSTFTMDLYLQNTYVRSFKVGMGKVGMETPTGLWRVKPGGKLVQPIWTNPIDGKTYHPEDPDYPLGSRWIALEGLAGEAKERTGFAIHGTKEPDQIGTQSSQGCIRMYNGEAILMYNLLVPTYSQVEITD